MTGSAMIFMFAVWSLIIGFTAYCFYKLLTSSRRLDGDDEAPTP